MKSKIDKIKSTICELDMVDTISYGKKLCFSGRYVNGLVTCFDNWPIE